MKLAEKQNYLLLEIIIAYYLLFEHYTWKTKDYNVVIYTPDGIHLKKKCSLKNIFLILSS